MNSFNILLICPYSLNEYGGVQSQILYSKEYLETQGYNVKILANRSNDYDVSKSNKIRFNGSISNVSLTCDRKLLNEAIHWADIIHIHEPFIPLILWGVNTDKIIITTHHAALNKLYSLVLKITYKLINSNKNITSTYVSPFSMDQASSLSNKLVHIPNFYQNTNLIEYSDNRRRLTFLGRHDSRKGINIFLNAIDSYIITKTQPTVLSNKIINKTYVESHINISNKAKFKILNETRLLIVPYTKNESFGVVIIEGILNGCVVICSDIPPFKNVLKDSGIYFNNKNSYNLNNVIKETLELDLNNIWKLQYEEISKYKTDVVMPNWIELYNSKMLEMNK